MKLDDILKEGSRTNIKDELAKHSLAIKYDCSGKGLTELKNVPNHITENFECQDNKLTSLKGGPTEVGGNFNCSDNKLTTLEHCPSVIKGGFYCGGNKTLKSLKGMPSKIGTNFSCFGNSIDSFEGAPSEVGGDISFTNNKLKSLQNIHKTIKRMNGFFGVGNNPIKSHVLGVLLIEGCNGLLLTFGNNYQHEHGIVEKIINKYLPNTEGMKGVLKCQEELFAADLDDFAQL